MSGENHSDGGSMEEVMKQHLTVCTICAIFTLVGCDNRDTQSSITEEIKDIERMGHAKEACGDRYDQSSCMARYGYKWNGHEWALSNHAPELDDPILKRAMEEKEKMIQKNINQFRDVVGVWIDERPYMGSKITIYRENGKLYLEMKHKDGSSSNDEMIESHAASGKNLEKKGNNPHGEYFVLDSKGGLQAGDKEGLFLTYKKLK